ncbi:HPr kinase/phosphorylase [Mycoplasmoides fastidiosum]|uniref:HPr kinase/phosphorylase n=1 Tax=Mycoplasmoides fastidiosum TaxID=92758 RepID=A0ABU0LY95_9BACT|nr:HPr(Ser) kinase/phosphatase [Mycoplasmoides fastidiosum]MDQ0513570.1 HPr kinase/phosphorylase [Mycoplasmoides fastidiosum]UUD38007.1 HPr(Ser) kinase/phosphatase [Mycoplasmoides fastidiosum]
MAQKYIRVAQLFTKLGGNFLNLTQHNQQLKITSPILYQAGLELAEIFAHPKIEQIISWGINEERFLQTLSPAERHKRLEAILLRQPPAIILSHQFLYRDELVSLSQKHDNQVPIIESNFAAETTTSILGTWLSRKFAQVHTLHGVLVNVFGEGVLITGEAGIGKSELAMELLLKNHLFVGDDSIDVAVIGNELWARANPVVAGFIELRGLGILNVKKMYGMQRLIDHTQIRMVIELRKEKDLDRDEIDRIGSHLNMKPLLGIHVPHYLLPVSYGKKLSDIAEAAVIDFKLKYYEHYFAFDEFQDRIIELTTRKDDD